MALLEPVAPTHALRPTNESERLLFRNISDNLIHLDCQENVRAGLAEAWNSDSVPGAWVFTLGENTGRRSGALLSAAKVVTAIRARLSTEFIGGIDSIAAVGDRQVRIFGSGDSVPKALADPALALVDSIALGGMNGEGDTPMPGHGPGPVVAFRVVANGDARDALEGGADLVIARSSTVLEYASGRPGLTSYPLPWARTYVMLQPPGSPPLLAVNTERPAFALDAVEADARPAESLSWLNETASCRSDHPVGLGAAPVRVVYQQGDAVARALAERMVAVADPGKGWRTLGLPQPEFARSLERGGEAAYVLAVPRRTLAPCRERDGWPAGARIQPLIETRAHAIIRDGVPPVAVDWDGMLRFTAP